MSRCLCGHSRRIHDHTGCNKIEWDGDKCQCSHFEEDEGASRADDVEQEG